MNGHYRIKITKETILNLESENEAKQVAELLSSREVKHDFIGNVCIVHSDYEFVG